jgi:hypothetical protein
MKGMWDVSERNGQYDAASKDKGSWRIDGDKFCRKWSNWKNGSEGCWKVTSKGDELRFVGGADAKLSNGNPFNIE